MQTTKEKICVFFSTVFPYETTLEREFSVLSKNFDKIYYFPTSIKEGTKPLLPENVILKDNLAVASKNWKKIGFKLWLKVFYLYFVALCKKANFKPYLKHYKTYISIAAKNILWTQILKKIIKENKLENAIFYDYWFENATLCLAQLKKSGVIKKVISRSHRFDLYDNDSKSWKVPYRETKINYLNKVYTVAGHGKTYLINKVHKKHKKKIDLSYLGVSIPSKINTSKSENVKLIVSASNTRDFKRVHFIPDVLKMINKPIKWLHFGTGSMDDILQQKINNLPPNIKAERMGFVPNEEVLKFYKENHVDLFLSLSLSEGLPISMMEAVAYGVPVFACNVCGIPDLVNENTGAMFEPEDDIDTISKKLNNALSIKFDKSAIRDFASQKFDYKKNYQKFVEEITEL